MPLLISPKELTELFRTAGSAEDISVLDASWHMPNSPLNAKEEFLKKRIPGARYFDLDDIASPNELGLKHMMPTGEIFGAALRKAGISPSSHIIIYDSVGIFSSPRALFTFKALGHDKASVLDGGLPAWELDGGSTETGPLSEVRESTYPPPTLNEEVVRSYQQVVNNASSNITDSAAELVLDARSRGRYLGSDPEPRAGLSSGHIPHSFSLPFNTFLRTNKIPNSDKTYTTFLTPTEIREKLVETVGAENAEQILTGKRKVITSCGSGMTAGVLWLGLKLANEATRVSIYDESWTGYASRKESPIVKSDG
ncbi:thiosulfate sulfurtransferase [Stereum hirsutum FP-91666 SS1]|uniref:thiosulfate sulfurtransferase n=1 Tax=Stereum hirsutum (strain FP-91666) TaxID=721885 RepID=UPI000440D893|nr:thiosulfate sulfurtransferase [Stereum hirsutum FP-91666 SS1]EIM92754.1 thiosulfate sulfurtransferase [Stereum hirsutum FP-91666 SS1]